MQVIVTALPVLLAFVVGATAHESPVSPVGRESLHPRISRQAGPKITGVDLNFDNQVYILATDRILQLRVRYHDPYFLLADY